MFRRKSFPDRMKVEEFVTLFSQDEARIVRCQFISQTPAGKCPSPEVAIEHVPPFKYSVGTILNSGRADVPPLVAVYSTPERVIRFFSLPFSGFGSTRGCVAGAAAHTAARTHTNTQKCARIHTDT